MISKPYRHRLIALALAFGLWSCGDGSSTGVTSSADPLPAPRQIALLAGTLKSGGAGDVDAIGADARLNQPSSLAIDVTGRLLVADSGNAKLKRVDIDGAVHTVADLGRFAQSLYAIDGRGVVAFEVIVAGRDGNAYVAGRQFVPGRMDSWIIVRVTSQGDTTVFVDPQIALPDMLAAAGNVNAMAFDAQGRLHIAVSAHCSILRRNDDGSLAVVWETPRRSSDGAPCNGYDEQWVPTWLAFDSDGRMAWGLAGGDGLIRTADGSVTHTQGRVATGLRVQAAFDRGGRLVVADADGARMALVARDGTVQTLTGRADVRGFDDGPIAVATFAEPAGLAIDGSGAIFVADSGNHNLRRIGNDALVSTYAGRAAQLGWRDGAGPQALFSAFGLSAPAADLRGGVVVVDGGNAALRRIAADGTVSTLAGDPTQRGTGMVDGGPGVGRFGSLAGLAADAAGDGWFVGDGGTLRRVGLNGQLSTVGSIGASGELNRAMASSRPGEVFVLNDAFTSYGRVSFYDHFVLRRCTLADARCELLLSSDGPHGPSRNAAAGGLAAAANGDVFLSAGTAVWRRRADGFVSVFAGSSIEAGSADGPAGTARFGFAGAMTIDAAGQLYVIDGCAVRQVSPRGDVSTLMGAAPVCDATVLGPLPGRLSTPTGVAATPSGLVVTQATSVLTLR